MKFDCTKTKNKKILLLILGPIFLFGVLFFGSRLLYEKVYVFKDQLAYEKLVLDNLLKEGGKIDKYKELEKKILFNSQIVDEAIVQKGNEIDLIRRIEEIAGQQGIEIQITDHQPSAKKRTSIVSKESSNDLTDEKTAGSDEQTASTGNLNYFMISTKSTYPHFLNFLYKLENLSLIVKIESVKTSSFSIFEIEEMKKEGRASDDMPTVKSDILISYTTR